MQRSFQVEYEQVSIGSTSLNVAMCGTGPPLLLVHGFPLDHSMWVNQLNGLSDIARVIAPDLRGFGNSGGADTGTITMSNYADDLAELLHAMNISEPVDFCGLSMGGYIAWEFYIKYQQRLRSLILCDTRAVADTPSTAKGRVEMALKVTQEGSVFLADSLISKIFAENAYEKQRHWMQEVRRVILQTDPQAIAAALRGMAERMDASPLLPNINLPTLVVCGKKDIISRPAEMKTIAEQIFGAQYAEIEDAGHMAPLEEHQQVNKAIREFLLSLK